MAHSGAGDYALGAGQGALGGAAAGASVGALFGPMAIPGAIIGGVAGLGLGILGTALDAKAQHKKEAALAAAEEEYQKALKEFESQKMQAGAAARESVKQAMTAKGASDSAAVSTAMDQASREADKSGLIGAEKADHIAKVRQQVEQARASSSPAVYQQALGGARQDMQLGIQKAAIGLQTSAGKYDTDVTQISGQETSSASAAIGQSLGAVAQTAGALHGADVSFAKGGTGAVTWRQVTRQLRLCRVRLMTGINTCCQRSFLTLRQPPLTLALTLRRTGLLVYLTRDHSRYRLVLLIEQE